MTAVTAESLRWLEAAACRGYGTFPFFAPDREHPEHREAREAQAKAVCARCPVRLRCLLYGLDVKHGVFGGLSEDERARERRNTRLRERKTP